MNEYFLGGLEKFKEYFNDYADKYIVIGGTACSILMGDAGLEFRRTKDIDMIICVEEITPDFGGKLWSFIKDGEYEIRTNKDGKACYYRFCNPKTAGFPLMIELFAKKQDIFSEKIDGSVGPIVVGEEISSLSAILLDDEYYAFLKGGTISVNGITVLKASHLIAFKAKAYLDLKNRKEKGESIDSSDIKKHKNDVYRLIQLLNEDERISASETITEDMRIFLQLMSKEKTDTKAIKIPLSKAEAERILKTVFRL